MPIMEVVLEQTFAGQQCINRWNYLASGTPAAVSFSFALISALGAIESAGVYPEDELMDLISEMQSVAVSFTQIGAKDVYSVDDFYEVPFVVTLAGTQAGEAVSPAIAMGFRTNRTRLDIRRATKRFVGLSENVGATGGSYTTAFKDNFMAPVAAKMSEVLEYDDEGNTLTFAPIVVGREKYSPSGNPAGPFAYRYYPTETEQLDHIMSSIVWDLYDLQRTQVSRQYGRGR